MDKQMTHTTGDGMATISPKAAAELIGVHHRTLLGWIKAGRLPARAISKRRWIILRSDFERFLSELPRMDASALKVD